MPSRRWESPTTRSIKNLKYTGDRTGRPSIYFPVTGGGQTANHPTLKMCHPQLIRRIINAGQTIQFFRKKDSAK